MSNRNPRKVYVSNISRDTRERDLGRLFEEVGRIDRLQFKNRFAFIEYERSRGCDDAVHKFDGMYFQGRRLRVEPYCYRGGDRKYRSDNYSNDYRVYICNLDAMTSWQDLKDFGRTAGKSVTFADVRVIRNDEHSQKRNELEGIIEYSDIRDFENGLKELDGARLNGVRVKVYSKSSYDRTKFSEDDHVHRNGSHHHKNGQSKGGRTRGSRSRTRSRSRSRSRTRSRSRSRNRLRGRNKKRSSYSPRSHSRSGSIKKDIKKESHRSNRNNSHSPSRSRSRASSKHSNHSIHSNHSNHSNHSKDVKKDYKSKSRSPSNNN